MVILNLTADVVEEFEHDDYTVNYFLAIRCNNIEIARKKLDHNICGYGDDTENITEEATDMLREMLSSKPCP